MSQVIGSDFNISYLNQPHDNDNDAHLAMAMDWQRVVPLYSSAGTCPNGRLGFSSGISSDKRNQSWNRGNKIFTKCDSLILIFDPSIGQNEPSCLCPS